MYFVTVLILGIVLVGFFFFLGRIVYLVATRSQTTGVQDDQTTSFALNGAPFLKPALQLIAAGALVSLILFLVSDPRIFLPAILSLTVAAIVLFLIRFIWIASKYGGPVFLSYLGSFLVIGALSWIIIAALKPSDPVPVSNVNNSTKPVTTGDGSPENTQPVNQDHSNSALDSGSKSPLADADTSPLQNTDTSPLPINSPVKTPENPVVNSPAPAPVPIQRATVTPDGGQQIKPGNDRGIVNPAKTPETKPDTKKTPRPPGPLDKLVEAYFASIAIKSLRVDQSTTVTYSGDINQLINEIGKEKQRVFSAQSAGPNSYIVTRKR